MKIILKKDVEGYRVFQDNNYIGFLFKEHYSASNHSGKYIGTWKAYDLWIFDPENEEDSYLYEQNFLGNLSWKSFKDAKAGIINILVNRS